MKDATEKLIRKNEKLKCKLRKIHRGRITTVLSVVAVIAVGVVVKTCFDMAKSKSM